MNKPNTTELKLSDSMLGIPETNKKPQEILLGLG